ncbi:MAG: DedA family protein [Terriglobia bacterium]
MEVAVLEFLISGFERYGYWIILLVTILETTVFIGVIVPGEVAVIAASFLASQGRFSLALVILVAAAGNITGCNISYFFGKSGGRQLIERYGHYFLVSDEKIRMAEVYFDKHGTKTVFFGRFVAVVKAFTNALAGAAKMEYWKFFIYSSASTLIWIVVFAVIGFLFGENWALIVKVTKEVGVGFLILLGLVGIGLYVLRKRRRARKDAQNEG